MESYSSFARLRTVNDLDFSVCSIWPEHSGRFEPNTDLCSIYILFVNQYYCVDFPIKTSCCNLEMIDEDFFQVLRSLFSKQNENYSYYFLVNDEDNTADIDIRVPISNGEISMFRATLNKYFKHDGVLKFMQQIDRVQAEKDSKILEMNQKIAEMEGLTNKVDAAKREVEDLLDQTGSSLASRFQSLYNDLEYRATTN